MSKRNVRCGRLIHVSHPLLDALDEPVEDFERRRVSASCVRANGQIVEVGPVPLEFGQITLKKVKMLGVKGLQIAVQEWLEIASPKGFRSY